MILKELISSIVLCFVIWIFYLLFKSGPVLNIDKSFDQKSYSNIRIYFSFYKDKANA